MKAIKDMTIEELKKAAAEYKAGMLEGGEGYNPYEAELHTEERIAENRRNLLDEFKKEWTLEVTKARRIEWNNFIKSNTVNGQISTKKIIEFQDKNFIMADLKKAIDIWGL